jgi:hypothetical protein
MSATSPVVLHAGQMDPKKLSVIYTFSREAASGFLSAGHENSAPALTGALESRGKEY